MTESADGGADKREQLYIASGNEYNENQYAAPSKTAKEMYHMTQLYLSLVFTQRLESINHREICSEMFIAALPTKAMEPV